MAKIIFSFLLLSLSLACGKKGDIPVSKIKEQSNPAKIEKERSYNF
ncbi:MAG: hypothetical protein CFH34_00233 [Alphaproteobacteria bacterium MarineAlpha9_Bin4]|nr:MAG: hypothetical protein CFH34_00233 [Alphaproteobacteria bacterium MarineAlpha9_Bin4]|tara:strand:+ start:1008 stop:1145 length:138 start_codon:yes stop_codon:yes gene_type:complete